MGNGTGGMLKPLDGGYYGGSNLRFRWNPTLRIGQAFKIQSVIDALDNMVMGSAPDASLARADSPFAFASDSQRPVSSRDSLRVKQAYGVWDIGHIMLLQVGRMGDHWGLGMVHNDGRCIDCDFGDSVDRASLLFRISGLNSLWFFDSPAEGRITQLPGAFGQAGDADNADDVFRWGFTIASEPMDEKTKEKRRQDLGRGKAVVDWGIRNEFVSQDFHTEAPDTSSSCVPGQGAASALDCVPLMPREASLWLPNLWLKLQWRPRYDMHLRLEFEAAAIVGDVKYTQNLKSPSSSKEFVGFGSAIELELSVGNLTWMLHTGFATGDELAFGSFGPGFHEPDDSLYGQNKAVQNNTSVGRFLFNRDYHIGMLLYREQIGTITNSAYVKPALRAYFIKSDAQELGVEVGALYGHALAPESTPGQEAPLGIEGNLSLFFGQPGEFSANLEGAVLMPLGAFKTPITGDSPEMAFTLQARLNAHF
jgi:uncharacterized protein (TIGR04551 family)